MVSNSLDMPLQELLAEVERLRREFGETPEYLEYRKDLPEDWPL